jgi:phosphatidylglycerophosphate synthase
MTTVTRLRLVVAAVGVAIWAWGYRVDDSRVRWAGMILLVAAILLRFFDGSRARSDQPPR